MSDISQVSAEQQGSFAFVLLISIVATIGGFLFGFDSGVINGTVSGLEQAFDSSNVATGFNVASMLLGCAVGAFFAGRLADLYGRRTMMMVAAIFFIVSAWGSGIAGSSMEFIVYRILGGLAVGAASIMAPAYISEVAPAHLRGRLTSIQQVAIITGLFSAFISNYLLAEHAGASTDVLWMGFDAWRWMFWIELAPAVIFLIALFCIPESPRFLVTKGKADEAKAVLARLIGPDAAATKVAEITESLEGESQPKFSDLLDKVTRKIHPVVLIGIGLATFQQLVGINVVFYYGAVLWQAVGFSESDALMINIISGAASMVAITVTLFTVDKIGRKPLLQFGSVGMAITLATMAWAFSNATMGADGSPTLEGNYGIAALVAANAYVFLFNMTWGPVMWVALGEMFPNKMRGSGLAVSGLFQWGANFGITMTFPIMLVGIGLAGAYSIYAGFAVISAIFVAKFVRETKGMELEDMSH